MCEKLEKCNIQTIGKTFNNVMHLLYKLIFNAINNNNKLRIMMIDKY